VSAATLSDEPSSTQLRISHVARSSQSLAVMPWVSGVVPVRMVAWPGAVSVAAWR